MAAASSSPPQPKRGSRTVCPAGSCVVGLSDSIFQPCVHCWRQGHRRVSVRACCIRSCPRPRLLHSRPQASEHISQRTTPEAQPEGQGKTEKRKCPSPPSSPPPPPPPPALPSSAAQSDGTKQNRHAEVREKRCMRSDPKTVTEAKRKKKTEGRSKTLAVRIAP